MVPIWERTLTKKRPLPSEDMANIAPLPLSEQRKQLRKLLGPALISYRSLRLVEDAIWGLSLPLPFSITPPTLAEILVAVTVRARRGKELESCLELARLFHALVQQQRFTATSREFGRLQLAVGVSVDYCADVVLAAPGSAPLIAGVNYRRRPYTAAGLRFAFSAMHEQSRALDRDLHGARLVMVQFPQPPKKRPRFSSLLYADSSDLFEYRQLAAMAAGTSELWVEMQEQADEQARRTGTDDKDWWGGE